MTAEKATPKPEVELIDEAHVALQRIFGAAYTLRAWVETQATGCPPQAAYFLEALSGIIIEEHATAHRVVQDLDKARMKREGAKP